MKDYVKLPISAVDTSKGNKMSHHKLMLPFWRLLSTLYELYPQIEFQSLKTEVSSKAKCIGLGKPRMGKTYCAGQATTEKIWSVQDKFAIFLVFFSN